MIVARGLVVVMVVFLSCSGVAQGQEPPTRAECEAVVAAQLAELAPGAAGGYVGAWSPEVAELFVLPADCPPLPFPPETPWCTAYRCIWNPAVVHTPDGLGYCLWIDWRGMWDCRYPYARD